MQSIQVAYLAKGLTNMRKLLNFNNEEMELAVRDQIKRHAINHH